MSAASDGQIVEALELHAEFDVSDGVTTCDCGFGLGDTLGDLDSRYRQHLAEVIEPIIKAREEFAFDLGRFGEAKRRWEGSPRNPYRTEPTP